MKITLHYSAFASSHGFPILQKFIVQYLTSGKAVYFFKTFLQKYARGYGGLKSRIAD